MTKNIDRYQDIAASFNEYLKDFFEPSANHTTYHFGYKPVIDIIRGVKNFPDISVIDYGAGAGQFCAYMHTLGVKVVGFEISDAMLQTAKQNFPVLSDKFLTPDYMPSAAQADICTMNFVTCEIQTEPDMDEILSNAHQLLYPGGKLIILTNNPEANPEGVNYNIWSIAPVDVNTEGSDVKITIHTDETSFELDDYFWSRKFMTNKLQSLGFEQVQSFLPRPQELNQKGWKDEFKYPPTLIYTAVKE